jgi:hypothetical protein
MMGSQVAGIYLKTRPKNADAAERIYSAPGLRCAAADPPIFFGGMAIWE